MSLRRVIWAFLAWWTRTSIDVGSEPAAEEDTCLANAAVLLAAGPLLRDIGILEMDPLHIS